MYVCVYILVPVSDLCVLNAGYENMSMHACMHVCMCIYVCMQRRDKCMRSNLRIVLLMMMMG